MTHASTRPLAAAAALLLAFGAYACSNSSPTAPGSSDGSTTSAAPSSGGSPPAASGGMGSLRINLTDSPFSDAKALLVTFSEVSVHRADGDAWETLDFTAGSSRTCDLKKLQGPVDVLGVGTLPTGKYTQVRLNVTTANIYFDNPSAGSACAPAITAPAGDFTPVEIPSGVVKLNREFTVAAGGTTMLLDFDGDKSVRQTGSGGSSGNGGSNGNGNAKGNGGGSSKPSNAKYMMSPVIRVVSVQ
jgi:hypothetical protein